MAPTHAPVLGAQMTPQDYFKRKVALLTGQSRCCATANHARFRGGGEKRSHRLPHPGPSQGDPQLRTPLDGALLHQRTVLTCAGSGPRHRYHRPGRILPHRAPPRKGLRGPRNVRRLILRLHVVHGDTLPPASRRASLSRKGAQVAPAQWADPGPPRPETASVDRRLSTLAVLSTSTRMFTSVSRSWRRCQVLAVTLY